MEKLLSVEEFFVCRVFIGRDNVDKFLFFFRKVYDVFWLGVFF